MRKQVSSGSPVTGKRSTPPKPKWAICNPSLRPLPLLQLAIDRLSLPTHNHLSIRRLPAVPAWHASEAPPVQMSFQEGNHFLCRNSAVGMQPAAETKDQH